MGTYSTLDNTPPTVALEFVNDKDDQVNPPADTSIRLVFSESILGMEPDATGKYYPVTLYDKYIATVNATGEDKVEKLNQFVNTLQKHVVLHEIDDEGEDVIAATPTVDGTKNQENANWVVDYKYATVTRDGKHMVITFPTTTDKSVSALNLQSGGTYYFQLTGIADTSEAYNMLDGTTTGSKRMNNFTTASAQIYLRNLDNLESIEYGGQEIPIHVAFEVNPHDTNMVTDDLFWDMILWSDLPLEFRLYRRDIDNSTGVSVPGEWKLLDLKDGDPVAEISTRGGTSKGISLQTVFNYPRADTTRSYERLHATTNHVYEYAIEFTKVNGKDDSATWNDTVTITVSAASGTISSLSNLGQNYISRDRWLAQDSFASIGYVTKTQGDELVIEKRLPNTKAPEFSGNYPTFTTKETSATVTLALDTVPGEVDWVVVKQGSGGKLDPTTRLEPDNSDSTEIRGVHAIEVPTSGGDTYKQGVNIYRDSDGVHSDADKNLSHADHSSCELVATHKAGASKKSPELTSPEKTDIVNPVLGGYTGAKSGSYTYDSSTAGQFEITDLESLTDYYIYFVLRNGGEESRVYVYQFTTKDVETPIITLTNKSPEAEIKTSTDAEVWYALIPNDRLPELLTQDFWKAAGKDAPNSTVANYKVIDAMINPCNNKGKSYFDQYAPASLKFEVYYYIHGRNDSSYWTDMGNSSKFKADIAQTVYLNNLDPYPQEYYLVTTAWNVNLVATDLDVNDPNNFVGDAYGFKALSSIYLIDHDPPAYKSSYTDADGTMKVQLEIDDSKVKAKSGFETITDTTNPDNAGNSYLYHPEYYLFSGTITLTFTRPLYLVTGNDRKIIVMRGSNDTNAFDSTTMVSALDLVSGSAAIKCAVGRASSVGSDGKYVATDTFVFTFTDAVLRDGSEFTFPSTDSTIASATSASTSQRLKLIFDSRAFTGRTNNVFGTEYYPGFIVTAE
jgi:hypothetical protein